MKQKIFFLAVVLFLPVLLLSASAVNAADGLLDGTGVWSDPSSGITDISWTVSWDGVSSYVHYAYTLNVNEHDISHFTLELSDDFTASDIANITIDGSSGTGDLNTYYGGDNPHNTMPGDLYGIKFDTTINDTTMTIEFDSTRMPEWGDFYARCGSRPEHESGTKEWNSAWNAGFASGEAAGAGNDPTAAAGSYSIANHILTPDTVGPSGDAFTYTGSLTMVPEPISSSLFIIGSGLLAGRRFMRRKK